MALANNDTIQVRKGARRVWVETRESSCEIPTGIMISNDGAIIEIIHYFALQFSDCFGNLSVHWRYADPEEP
jgi:hypothetical protein